MVGGPDLAPAIGRIPYRLALAGGWIDQPFVSRLNPDPPGAMVVVGLQPNARYMERCGFATGTRRVAGELWGDALPDDDPAELVRKLYAAENAGRTDPSGSQDMIGLIYPGVCRLDYRSDVEAGVFPSSIEQCSDETVLAWLEASLWLLPVSQRPEGYGPLGERRLDADWVRRLGMTGHQCFAAITRCDLPALGASMNACMECWAALLPQTVRHPTIRHDLVALLHAYQQRYPGAMYSGCGGGYLIVASGSPVPGALQVSIRR